MQISFKIKVSHKETIGRKSTGSLPKNQETKETAYSNKRNLRNPMYTFIVSQLVSCII